MTSQQSPAGKITEIVFLSRNALLEWLAWTALVSVALLQTGNFDQPMKEYVFGAAGWPRTVCYAILIGATWQLAFQIYRNWRGVDAFPVTEEGETPRATSGIRRLQRAAFFILPFIYLFATARIGFYITTPVFIICLLLLMEVWSITALLSVTAVIYGIALLVFTRFFYVAVPVGNISPFYEINTAIIVFARTGM